MVHGMDWATSAGVLRVEGYPSVPRLQIVTIEEALEKKDKAVDAPLRHADTYRAAPCEEVLSRQGRLEFRGWRDAGNRALRFAL